MTKLPKGWKLERLDKLADVQTGVAKGAQSEKPAVSVPYLRVANVQDGHVDLTEMKVIEVPERKLSHYLLRRGDLLMTEGGDFDKLGRGCIWEGQIDPCVHQNHVFAVRVTSPDLRNDFLEKLAASPWGRRYFVSCSKQSTNLASINTSQLKAFPVLVPPLPEQRKIGAILGAWDRAIEKLQALVAAKSERLRVLREQLITGTRRFSEFARNQKRVKTKYGAFPADWTSVHIGEIADEAEERNSGGGNLPVLSCTKHRGLVASLEYFSRRVFSQDTSAYKVVRRGQFAYATNHIEEGSIGYQDLYDTALISPMYTVFQLRPGVDHAFFFKLLKTEVYRHIFEVNTSGSIDRRGALRWRDFAHIRVFLPGIAEQQRVAAVLNACANEIRLLETELAALKLQKRGLMQKLLTGEVRVKP